MALHPLIEAQELHALLAAPGDVVLLDVRWALGDPNGHAHYLDGHLPGAVFVDLHHELAAEPTPEAGRHPLPTAGAFQAAAQRWGINPGLAGRRLRRNARACGGPRLVAAAPCRVRERARAQRRAGRLDRRRISARTRRTHGDCREPWSWAGTALPTIDIDQAEHFPGRLLDARAFERYTGATEPIDPRAGHIPGALSNPTTENLGADGRFLDPCGVGRTLRARWALRAGRSAGGRLLRFRSHRGAPDPGP